MALDIEKFGRVINPEMFTIPSAPFHKELYAILKDEKKEYISLKAPRGSAKSSIVGGIFPLHHLMFAEGKKFVVLTSKTQGHAIKLLQTIKDILNYSETFRYYFGYWGMHKAQKWTNDTILLKDGSMIMAMGAGQQVVGLKNINQRPTLFIVDDPEDLNNTKTAEAMAANQRWLLQGVVPARDAVKGRIIVIGTPQHANCIVETLPMMDKWFCKSWRSIDGDLSTGNVLWPEMMTREKLLQEKEDLTRIGKVSIWYSERQCEIVGDSDQLFKPEMWEENYFEDYNLIVNPDRTHSLEIIKNGKLLGPFPVTVFIGVDPASSTRATSDYSVTFPIAMDSNRNRYTLRPFRKRSTPIEHATDIIEKNKKMKPNRVTIETTGYQEMLRDYLRQQDDYIPGLERKVNPRASKSSRLDSMVTFFSQKQVHILSELKWFVDELCLYPRSKHEDGMDAFYYANKFAYPPDWVANEPKDDLYRINKANIDWMTL
jgi:hypothetical protein